MKYAYLKNGDAVDQLRRILGNDKRMRSGPDAFMADFVYAHSKDDLLVLCKGPPRDLFSHGRAAANSLQTTQSSTRWRRYHRKAAAAGRRGTRSRHASAS